jgi:hypothetical protein
VYRTVQVAAIEYVRMTSETPLPPQSLMTAATARFTSRMPTAQCTAVRRNATAPYPMASQTSGITHVDGRYSGGWSTHNSVSTANEPTASEMSNSSRDRGLCRCATILRRYPPLPAYGPYPTLIPPHPGG